ncbi:MAG: DUF2785 domain-containing protein [Candidatus Atribacteria bacterium]|nr:MAG: DUF2785 domain-containing protein [Candidatus Atribacteria bacterium]
MRERIQKIIDSGYEAPLAGEMKELTAQITAGLAATDAAVREGSMEILWHWGQAGVYSDSQLLELGQQMADNLSVGLGDPNSDSVFLRAFSALILAMVIVIDQRCECGQIEERRPFLSKRQVHEWLGAALSCLDKEQDRRGFTEDFGWAHSIAHVSDALGDFARSRHLNTAELEQILQAIADKIIEPCDVIYPFGEDSRLARSTRDVLLRDQVSMAFLTQWLDTIAHGPGGSDWAAVLGLESCDIQGNNARMNARSFLYSLYFQLAIHPGNARAEYFADYYARPMPHRDELMAAIVEAIKTMQHWGNAQE